MSKQFREIYISVWRNLENRKVSGIGYKILVYYTIVCYTKKQYDLLLNERGLRVHFA